MNSASWQFSHPVTIPSACPLPRPYIYISCPLSGHCRQLVAIKFNLVTETLCTIYIVTGLAASMSLSLSVSLCLSASLSASLSVSVSACSLTTTETFQFTLTVREFLAGFNKKQNKNENTHSNVTWSSSLVTDIQTHTVCIVMYAFVCLLLYI